KVAVGSHGVHADAEFTSMRRQVVEGVGDVAQDGLFVAGGKFARDIAGAAYLFSTAVFGDFETGPVEVGEPVELSVLVFDEVERKMSRAKCILRRVVPELDLPQNTERQLQ